MYALIRCCIALHHTATHCNTLQHTATHCNTLQHTATHHYTLQHAATHYHTPQQDKQAVLEGVCARSNMMMPLHSSHARILASFQGPGRLLLQCVAVRCSVLQCVTVCCSVLQCVAVSRVYIYTYIYIHIYIHIYIYMYIRALSPPTSADTVDDFSS